METSQAESISSIQAAPGTAERFINLSPNDSEEAIQVPFETVKKFKLFIENMLEDDDFEESVIPLQNINFQTLLLLVKYANL